jgi:hypothetical protein
VDQLRELLELAGADARPYGLPSPGELRARGERRRRQRRLAGALAGGLVVVAAVLLVANLKGLPRAQPVTTPRPTPSAPVPTFVSGCGFSNACPAGRGPFRFLLNPDQSGEQLSVGGQVPSGWWVRAVTGTGVVVQDTDSPAVAAPHGVALLWPVTAIPGSGTTGARQLADKLAELPGSESTTPRQVALDGHTGWQVTLTTPAGLADHQSTGCLNPQVSLFPDRSCRPLFELGPGPLESESVGLTGTTVAEVTLLDGFDVSATRSQPMLAIWRWGVDQTTPAVGNDPVLSSLRLARYYDPACSQDPTDDNWTIVVGRQCAAPNGVFTFHGAPVVTLGGIQGWLAQAKLTLPRGWQVGTDSALGSADVGDTIGDNGAWLVWDPVLPRYSAAAVSPLENAQAWARMTATRPSVIASAPIQVTVAGLSAWRVDLTPEPGQRGHVGGCDLPSSDYSVTVACSPVATQLNTTYSSAEFELDMRARLWFIQAGPSHVLLVMVWSKPHINIQDPSAGSYPALLISTRPTINRLEIATGYIPAQPAP